MINIYTGGTFDVPHIGHYNFFKQIKILFPDSEIRVALNRDEFIERFKGKKPLFSYSERENFLSMIEHIDYIVPNIGDESSIQTISSYDVDVIAIGNDWLEKDYCAQMGFDAIWLQIKGISLIYIPYTEGISTTEIKKRISNAT